MAAAATATATARQGFRRMFSTSGSGFARPRTTLPPPKADPNPSLFVSGLSKRTTSEGLKEAFKKFGRVMHARVVTDRNSGYSRGFGFVRYETVEEAARGIEGLDGKFLGGWVIFAEYARLKYPPQQEQETAADIPPQI
ncbi:glycine-rich RNA-binding-like protein [Rhynchospora pubera]|uniref:Glycine-rich RNA-binding-like protein n=1 Tax=Rhynchospora pubera TaxID=906938 RepID=A0AAV8HF29_9POAL|nr:glycine-rich RNA-binding-like protein [Rhynchospora pubera]